MSFDTLHLPVPRSRSGFTLMELLLAVTLSALAVSLISVNLTGNSTRARTREAVSRLRNLDAWARVVARSEGPVHLRASADGDRLWLARDGQANAIGATWQFEHARVRLWTSEPVRSIPFDGTGVSPDYTLSVHIGKDLIHIEVAGDTGWIEERPRS